MKKMFFAILLLCFGCNLFAHEIKIENKISNISSYSFLEYKGEIKNVKVNGMIKKDMDYSKISLGAKYDDTNIFYVVNYNYDNFYKENNFAGGVGFQKKIVLNYCDMTILTPSIAFFMGNMFYTSIWLSMDKQINNISVNTKNTYIPEKKEFTGKYSVDVPVGKNLKLGFMYDHKTKDYIYSYNQSIYTKINF